MFMIKLKYVSYLYVFFQIACLDDDQSQLFTSICSQGTSRNTRLQRQVKKISYLYAYKDDVKNGFTSKKNLCLWEKDGKTLLRKYFRESDDTFVGSMIYGSRKNRRKSNYLELDVVYCKAQPNIKLEPRVRVCNLSHIEVIISKGNFGALNLPPYVCYKDKKYKSDDKLEDYEREQQFDLLNI